MEAHLSLNLPNTHPLLVLKDLRRPPHKLVRLTQHLVHNVITDLQLLSNLLRILSTCKSLAHLLRHNLQGSHLLPG